ncbi:hypothetical protein DTO271G3_5984 [Paecilomyces variotii]|nr:hypothetical protein DTO271G3_5984 [Paecilomyces variotii]
MATTTYTLEEVQKHNKADDVWIVLHNKVYNITKYLEDHPGGAAILVEVGGTDATEAFEDIGHSDEARDALKDFEIGKLPSEEEVEVVEVYRPKYEAVSQEAAVKPIKRGSNALARCVRILVPLAAAGAIGATAYQAYRNPRAFSLTPYLNLLQSDKSSTTFWAGFAIASAAQFTFSAGFTAWLWAKLDVQQEFTHYPAHKQTKRSTIIVRKAIPPPRPRVLDSQKFKNFKLVKKTRVSPNVYRFVFGLPRPDDVLGLPTGQHIALRATINGHSVSRSYTPVSNNTDLGRIELLVKVYEGGQMTKHLESMEIGDTIEIRGPKGAMQYSRSYAKHIGMIAGGTGITPMYQLIRAICEDEGDNTQVSLLYANNTEEDILLKEELDSFAQRFPHKFKVTYVLSRPSDSWKGPKGFVTTDLIKERLAPVSKDSKVLLCGPPPMINIMKKNLTGLGFEHPSAVSKATDQIFLF